MTDMVDQHPTTVVHVEEILEVAVTALTEAGATTAEARQQAATLLEADLRDQHSHGLQRLPVLVGRLQNGVVQSGIAPELRWVSPSYLSADGNRGFGPVVAHKVIDELLPRVRSNGIAIAAVRNSNHLGILAPYVEAIAATGAIGLALTTSEALVHPWGGSQALVGTNPIAIAVPTESEPIVLDMSTSQVSMGKVLSYAAQDAQIPLGWAVDEFGEQTNDPHAAVRGAISPFGGAKGYALGVALESMVGVLSGSAFGTDVKGTLDIDNVPTKGEVFIGISGDCVNPQSLADLTNYLRTIRASGPTEQALRVPGDRSRQTRQERMAHGVPLPSPAWHAALGLLEVPSADPI